MHCRMNKLSRKAPRLVHMHAIINKFMTTNEVPRKLPAKLENLFNHLSIYSALFLEFIIVYIISSKINVRQSDMIF